MDTTGYDELCTCSKCGERDVEQASLSRAGKPLCFDCTHEAHERQRRDVERDEARQERSGLPDWWIAGVREEKAQVFRGGLPGGGRRR